MVENRHGHAWYEVWASFQHESVDPCITILIAFVA